MDYFCGGICILIFSFDLVGKPRSFAKRQPIPLQVVTTDGNVLIGDGEVLDGQNVWQAMGGMQVGSIWGHGSYVAPDWTADYLHRESVFVLDKFSNKDFGKKYDDLTSEQQAALRQRLQDNFRKNTFDTATGKITIDPLRAEAFEANLSHYSRSFRKATRITQFRQTRNPIRSSFEN